jgi:hypothetical protein
MAHGAERKEPSWASRSCRRRNESNSIAQSDFHQDNPILTEMSKTNKNGVKTRAIILTR